MRSKPHRWFVPMFVVGFLLSAAGTAAAAAWTLKSTGCNVPSGASYYICNLPNFSDAFPISRYGNLYFDGDCYNSSCLLAIVKESNDSSSWYSEVDYQYVGSGHYAHYPIGSRNIKNNASWTDFLYGYAGSFSLHGMTATTG
jgi:hypothetical protein